MTNENECVPFRIGNDDIESGPRLGGRPPDGIEPRSILEARYFATIPLRTDPNEELSIFFPMRGDVVAASSGVLHTNFIEVIVHPESTRGGSNNHRSPLPEHPLFLLPSRDDFFEDDEGQVVVESHHKLGGRPFLIHDDPETERALRLLSAAGYHHIVQFDFPAGGDDAIIDGPWPFIDGMFHLFGRRNGEMWNWQWFWDF